MLYRGRFAPSPTGALHLGSAATALLCAARAIERRGVLVMRVEDLDAPRVVAGAEAALLDDLAWLGLAWDEGPGAVRGAASAAGPSAPYRQSERLALYDAAFDDLKRRGHVYPCDCSRAEIAQVASAPHAGEEGPRYPGTCRPDGGPARGGRRAFKRPPAWRLAVPKGDAARVAVGDAVLGRLEEDVAASVGDFVLRRGDGVYAYQFAVVVDDLAMGITEVVRGADLAASAPRQALLAGLVGGRAPTFAHVPLVVGDDGARLAKRARGVSIADQRAAGTRPEALVLAIAAAFGHALDEVEAREATPARLVRALGEQLDFARLPREPVPVSAILERLARAEPVLRATPG